MTHPNTLIKVASTRYNFGEIVLVARTWQGCYRASWVLICPDCQQEHAVHKQGSSYWVARCHLYKAEYTITPKEFFVAKERDFTQIMDET